jgi:hypothetical protein
MPDSKLFSHLPKHIKIRTVKDLLFVSAAVFIAYWPVSFRIFSLKNDSMIQYLPYRYHLSEAIQHGYFPFWSPYLYTGFPVHADMQGMTFNPIVLILSLFTRYNMSVLQLEVTIYLVLAAVGMYSLLKSFGLSRMVSITGAISYASCGFINGSASVIPWISSAAFIPFVLLCFRKFIYAPQWVSAVQLSITLSLLFLCCYPTFFIYTAYLLVIIFLAAVFTTGKIRNAFLNFKSLAMLVTIWIIFLCICSPAIISYWEFLPYYSRGGGISLEKAGENPFTLISSISFLLPGTALTTHIGPDTDISMKNTYTGIFIVFLFFASLFKKYSREQSLVLALTLFSFLLSLGAFTPVHKLCYQLLPLFNSFRHPGNIRLFTTIGILLLTAIYTDKIFVPGCQPNKKKIIRFLLLMSCAMAALLIYFLATTEAGKGLMQVIHNIKQGALFPSELNPGLLTATECLLQIFFLLMAVVLIRIKTSSQKKIAGVFILNAIVFCWIALPFTFISKTRTQTVDAFLEPFTDGYPFPDLKKPVKAYLPPETDTISGFGYQHFYSKDKFIHSHAVTPTLNRDYEKFIGNIHFRKLVNDYPFAYLADTIISEPDALNYTGQVKHITLCSNSIAGINMKNVSGEGVIAVKSFGPNGFVFETEQAAASLFTIFQQYNHNWKAIVNGKEVPILKVNIGFMGIPVQPGKNTIEFIYKPRRVLQAGYLCISTLIALLLIFLKSMQRQQALK